MTSTVLSTGLLARLRELLCTHAELWATLERIDPDSTPYLHWEPTTAGWRLYGHAIPPG